MIDEFEPFPKIPRLFRDVVITEKIDGTNAQVVVSDDMKSIRAASRKRWITPEQDNFGFARWVEENKDELLKLGPGRHFGEWWGRGIQRGYGLEDRRFSLFNTHKWGGDRPACCDVVPVLYQGPFDLERLDECLMLLRELGSTAAPGFGEPEGIIVYHTHANSMFKVTLYGDQHKG